MNAVAKPRPEGLMARVTRAMVAPVKRLHPNMRKMRRYTPHIHVSLDTRRFTVKTVEHGAELAEVLRLRHDVFYREMLNKRKIFQLDLDRFDFLCDHLVIIDKRTNDIVGTYRLNASTFSSDFYTETEFHFEPVRNLQGHKLELGRACVKDGYRNGITLTLMWKGVLHYMQETGCRYLFGCSSVKTTDPETIRALHRYMTTHYSLPELHPIRPRKAFQVKNLHRDAPPLPDHQIEEHIPPLLQFYLKCGARVCGEPALDKAFKCIDFLTILDLDQLNRDIGKRFNRC